MNVADANTEPFYQFHRFNEELNRTMRITVAGLVLVKQLPSQNSGVGPIQLPTDGEPWGENLWNNPSSAVAPAKRFISQMATVRVITALEDFCIGVKAEHDRYARFQGAAVDNGDLSEIEEEGFSPTKLYSALEWDKGILDALSPLYDFFSKVRNCIAHRSGRASKELDKLAGSSRLTQCVNNWHGSGNKTLPQLPAASTGNELQILPRHAILASEVCRRIAVDANQKLCSYLGAAGIVNMAAYHSLLSPAPIQGVRGNSAQAMLNWILTNRYHVRLAAGEEAVRELKRLGKWIPYSRKFERLRGKQES